MASSFSNTVPEHSDRLSDNPKVTDNAVQVSTPGLQRFNCQPREEQLVLNTVRCLAADLCQQASRSVISR